MSESHTTGQFANVDIKQEVIECGEHKIESQYLDLPMKIDHDSLPENTFFFSSTIKNEIDTTNKSKTTYFKQEIDRDEQFTTESELLSSYCNFPTLENESVDYPDYFEQSYSSKQVENTSKRPNNITKVFLKKSRYACPVCQKNFPSSKSRSKHIDGHFGKRFTVCQFCGKLMTKIDFLRHYFIHIVKYKFGNSSEKINKDSWLQQHFKKSIQSDISSKKNNFNYILQCDICLKEFHRKSNLQRHLVIHSGEKPFKCEICSKGFNDKSNLQTHLKNHTNEKLFNCNICSKKFHHNSILQRHLISHTNKKPFKCDICSKEFKQKSYLQKHSIIHTNKKPFKLIIFKEFYPKYNLQHLKINSNKNPFNCDICSKKFNHKHSLQLHLLNHTNEKPFKCDICSKKYKRNSVLQKHLIIHTNEKPYNCDLCSKKFNHKSNLRQHLKIHSNEKRFNCDICSKKFNRKDSLQRHYLITHTNEKPFKCDVCSKNFNQKSNLQRHIIMHNNQKPYKCDVCCKGFNDKSYLRRHLIIHTNEKS